MNPHVRVPHLLLTFCLSLVWNTKQLVLISRRGLARNAEVCYQKSAGGFNESCSVRSRAVGHATLAWVRFHL